MGRRGVTRALLITLDYALLAAVMGGVMWLGVRWTLPLLERGAPAATNYRGASVPTGLGLVWLFLVAAVGLSAVIGDAVTDLLFNVIGVEVDNLSGVVPLFSRSADLFLRAAEFALPVAVVGFVDDVFGSGEAKGFRGHARALRGGASTTGAFKAVGIVTLAVVATWRVAPAMWGGAGSVFRPSQMAGWVLAAALVAGSANLVNLTDLRPGRALKVYGALVGVAGIGLASTDASWSGVAPIERVVASAAVVLLALLPVFAVWRADLSERAMLGDAGANAFGFVAGALLVVSYPPVGVAIGAAAVVTLNLVSERVSFTAAIERNAFLRWLDGLGRD